MSHDNRFSKTNYLKTNLLKQIKNSWGLRPLSFIRCKGKNIFSIPLRFFGKNNKNGVFFLSTRTEQGFIRRICYLQMTNLGFISGETFAYVKCIP